MGLSIVIAVALFGGIGWVLYKAVSSLFFTVQGYYVATNQTFTCFEQFWPEQWQHLVRSGIPACISQHVTSDTFDTFRSVWSWLIVDRNWVWLLFAYLVIQFLNVILDRVFYHAGKVPSLFANKDREASLGLGYFDGLIYMLVGLIFLLITYQLNLLYTQQMFGCWIDLGVGVTEFSWAALGGCWTNNVAQAPAYMMSWWPATPLLLLSVGVLEGVAWGIARLWQKRTVSAQA